MQIQKPAGAGVSPRCCVIIAVAAVAVAILGVLASTVVYQQVSVKLADGLRQHYVLDSTDAGGYADWSDSDTPGGPLILTDFYVYSIENPWDVSAFAAESREGAGLQTLVIHSTPRPKLDSNLPRASLPPSSDGDERRQAEHHASGPHPLLVQAEEV